MQSNTYININSIKSRLKSLKQNYSYINNIFAYIGAYYDKFKNNFFFCIILEKIKNLLSSLKF